MARERGSVTLWVAVVVMVATVLALVVARVAAAGEARGRAQAVADLAALAAVEGGRPAARAVADGNDAELVSYAERDGRFDVAVRCETAVARASADAGGAPDSPTRRVGEMPTGESLPLDSLRGVQPP
jgi:hypothetical protein